MRIANGSMHRGTSCVPVGTHFFLVAFQHAPYYELVSPVPILSYTSSYSYAQKATAQALPIAQPGRNHVAQTTVRAT